MTFGRTDGRACVCARTRPRGGVGVAARRVCEVPLGPPYTMN